MASMGNTVMNLCLPYSGECRLNSLPDPVRSHIVSFLPLKDAAKSSILSRQWRRVFSSLIDLNFDESKLKKIRHITFRNLVDLLLLQHDMSSIRSFSLSAGFNYVNDVSIDAWVSFAVKHNVRHLYVRILSSPWSNLMRLPCCIFTCVTLQELRLEDMKLDFPSAISLPKLKRVKLTRVQFHATIFSTELLSSCPVLEDLALICCMVSSSTISISVPTLQMLTLRGFNSTIDICAPKLRLIRCLTSCLGCVSSETLQSLICAEFDDFWSGSYSLMAKILSGLTNVKTLSLYHSSVRYMYRNVNSLPCSPTLRHLQLEMCALEVEIKVLLLLLRGFANLQTLKVSFVGTTKIFNIDACQQAEEDSTSCPLMSLKTVEIKDLALENEYELDILKYVLQNGKVLEEIKIKYYAESIKTKAKIQLRINEMYETFAKISPLSKIVFIQGIQA